MIKKLPTFVSFLLVCFCLKGCSPAQWAAVDAAGAVAKVAACAICQSGAPVQDQAAEHAQALKEIFEAIARLAEVANPSEVARLRADAAELQARERLLTETLIKLVPVRP